VKWYSCRTSCSVSILCQFPDGPLQLGWYAPCTCQHKTKGTLCRWWLHGRGHTVCGDRVGGTGERTPSNIDTTLLQYTLHTPHVKRNMKKTRQTAHVTTCHTSSFWLFTAVWHCGLHPNWIASYVSCYLLDTYFLLEAHFIFIGRVSQLSDCPAGHAWREWRGPVTDNTVWTICCQLQSVHQSNAMFVLCHSLVGNWNVKVLYLSTGWRWVVSFRWAPLPRESGCGGKVKNLCHYWELNSDDFPAHSPSLCWYELSSNNN
jgi:hypothetical protein